ncbi:hypothetical protein KDN32_04285 [Nocardioides sp. J2M5]|uniref:DUF6036 family nucleotidyltransferase n=1 Tax=Nocardioides palaemonis TaxID=2829810 RepID=UPI001BA764ED|nr:DUF6036 family nucleotidyltransferase [Nocardioides palaemonis]MBS2936961.1 hypothetical protein [Nocardioides palaemonis]
MNRDELAEVLRAASQLVDDRPVVMGSQAILGTYDEDVLPPAATVSMEADVAFLDDPDRMKADLVTGAIGEESNFHQLRGYYAEGIHVETATLPHGWRERLISWTVPAGANGPGAVASFLEPHDLVVAKLAAFREKDVRFVTALARAGLVDPDVALQRLEHTDLHPVARQRAAGLLAGLNPAPPTEDAGAERLRRSIENEKRVPPRQTPGPGRDRGR